MDEVRAHGFSKWLLPGWIQQQQHHVAVVSEIPRFVRGGGWMDDIVFILP
jgi:hypothetical protein